MELSAVQSLPKRALLGVNLDSISAKPLLEGVEVLLEVEGCCGGSVWGNSSADDKKDGGIVWCYIGDQHDIKNSKWLNGKEPSMKNVCV